MRILAGLTVALLGAALDTHMAIGGVRANMSWPGRPASARRSAPDDEGIGLLVGDRRQDRKPAAGSRRPIATAATA